METVETHGNDASNSIHRIVPGKKWCFTLNNYTKLEEEDIKAVCLVNNIKYIIGKEIGNSGTPHLQGFIISPKKIRPSETFNLCKRIHWEKKYKKSTDEDCINYCSKDNNFESTFALSRKDTFLDTLKINDFHNIFIHLWGIYNTVPDRRKIYYVLDKIGGIGKTTWAKWMISKYEDVCYISLTKSSDIVMAAQDYYKLYIIDICRSTGEFAPYNAIEQLKNGLIQDAKLKKEIRTVNCAPPHIIILSNSVPNVHSLSKDRWMIYEIDRTNIPDGYCLWDNLS